MDVTTLLQQSGFVFNSVLMTLEPRWFATLSCVLVVMCLGKRGFKASRNAKMASNKCLLQSICVHEFAESKCNETNVCTEDADDVENEEKDDEEEEAEEDQDEQ